MASSSDSREFTNARQRGSVDSWPIGETYIIEEGRLIEVGGPDKSSYYYPFAFPELPTHFARLSSRKESDVLAFTGRWGFLGFHLWTAEALAEKRLVGYSVEFILKHAEQVKNVLRLIHLTERRDDDRLSDLIQDMMTDTVNLGASGIEMSGASCTEVYEFEFIDVQGRVRRLSNTFIYATSSSLDSLNGESDDDSKGTRNRALARTLILEFINANMYNLRLNLTGHDNMPLTRSYIFDSLLTVIYAQLADAATGRLSYVECVYCGQYFEQTDKRQRFCPPGVGESQSLCSLKSRLSKHRERKLEGRGGISASWQ